MTMAIMAVLGITTGWLVVEMLRGYPSALYPWMPLIPLVIVYVLTAINGARR